MYEYKYMVKTSKMSFRVVMGLPIKVRAIVVQYSGSLTEIVGGQKLNQIYN